MSCKDSELIAERANEMLLALFFEVVQPFCTKISPKIKHFVDDPYKLPGNVYKTLQGDIETCLYSVMMKNPYFTSEIRRKSGCKDRGGKGVIRAIFTL